LKIAESYIRYKKGSVLQMFTSCAIMEAFWENKISTDQTIDTYFQERSNLKKKRVGYMMDHGIGIHYLANDKSYPEFYTEAKS
jgi:hypothetical protein